MNIVTHWLEYRNWSIEKHTEIKKHNYGGEMCILDEGFESRYIRTESK